MKSMLRTFPGHPDRLIEKQQVSNQQRVRGVSGLPEPPRDLQVQPAAGGVLVTWKLPVGHDRVAGWRIYLDTESNLVAQVRDKGTRQMFIPLSSGPTPNSSNIMVSAITTLGRESGKRVVSAIPPAQAWSTVVPSVPPGYRDEGPGGANRGLIRFKGETQYIR